MLLRIFFAWSLLAVTVVIHAVGLVAIARYLVGPVANQRFWTISFLLIRVAWWLVLLHLIEIAVWALFFWSRNCLPSMESAFYFSGVTYATVGYGDLVLPQEWRLFGPLEGLTGILMCGLSVSYFFAVVSRTFRVEVKT